MRRKLKSDGQLDEQLRKSFDVQLKKLRASWRFDEAESPVKAVHDLRVASRRLRALGDVVEHGSGQRAGRKFRRRLASVARAVSALRNADVLTTLVERELAAASSDADRAGLEHLLERLASMRETAERKARDHLERVDLAVLSAQLSADFDGGLRRAARSKRSLAAFGIQLVEQRLADAIDRLPPPGATSPSEEALHRLRIVVKKLRYAAELFDGALGRRGADLAKRAAGMQDQLGRRHDLAVLLEIATAELAKLEAHGRRSLARSLRKLIATLEAHREQLDCDGLRVRMNSRDSD